MHVELISAVILIIWFALWHLQRKKIAKCIKEFPGPAGWPIIGNSLAFREIQHKNSFSVLCNYCKKWPKRFRVWAGNEIMILLYDANDVEAVLTSSILIDKSLLYDFLHPWLGTGLLTSTGRKWHMRRKLLTPSFHLRILSDFIPVFNEQCDTLIEVLSQHVNKPSFDIYSFITLCTLDIICESVMGVKVNALINYESPAPYIKAIERIKDIIHSRMYKIFLWPELIFRLSSEGREFAKCVKIIHQFTEKVIRERKIIWEQKSKTESFEKKNKEPRALLDSLLEASDNGKNLSDSDIREEVDTFLFEGHDTTAVGISWTLFLLGHNQHIQKKVHEELDSIESLRLYPSVPLFARKVNTDTVIDGKIVPAQVTLNIVPYFLHRDPVVFPNPETFDPSRFFPENCVNRNPFAYIPFSAGSRNCIGQKFAMLKLKVVLARVLHSFIIESLDPQDRVGITIKIVMVPEHGINVHLTPRNTAKPT